MPESCAALATMVESTVSRSSVELTAWLTSPSARSSPTERPSSSVRCAQLVEQPRVLDGDHRLVGEVREQLNLLVGERTHFLTIDGDRADQLVLLQHRHGEKCPHAAELDRRNSGRKAFTDVDLVSREVSDMNHLFGRDQAAEDAFRTGTVVRRQLAGFGKGCGRIVRRDVVHDLAVPAGNIAKRGAADADAFSSMAANTGSRSPGELLMI